MAISLDFYVDINSATVGDDTLPARSLAPRIYTTNPRVPYQTTLEYQRRETVAAELGTDSDEYAIASYIFGWTGKQAESVRRLSFARWPDVAIAPTVYGASGPQLLSTYSAISDGGFVLTLGDTTVTLSGIDFSTATSISDVAGVIETAIQAADASTMFTAATVEWDAAFQQFVLTGGDTGTAAIDVQPAASGTDLSVLLGFLTGARLSHGSDALSITDMMTESADRNNNFGSFYFLPELSEAEHQEASRWQYDQNFKFLYLSRVTNTDAATLSDSLSANQGTVLTLSETAGEYPELLPGLVLGATRYDRANSTVNYMYQTDDRLTASVTSNTQKNVYDQLNVNYMGQVQNAGTYRAFYQQGVCVDGTAINVYANEIWLQEQCRVTLFNLLLTLNKVSWNETGEDQVRTQLESDGAPIELALESGVISVNKPIDVTTRQFITNQTGDDTAWQTVQNQGYWLDVTTSGNANSPVIEYTLIYSQDDVVRRIDGAHQLV